MGLLLALAVVLVATAALAAARLVTFRDEAISNPPAAAMGPPAVEAVPDAEPVQPRVSLAKTTDTAVARLTPGSAAHAIGDVTSVVRAAHLGIAEIPFSVLEAIPATRQTSRIVRGVHHGISRRVYGAIAAAAAGAVAARADEQSGGRLDHVTYVLLTVLVANLALLTWLFKLMLDLRRRERGLAQQLIAQLPEDARPMETDEAFAAGRQRLMVIEILNPLELAAAQVKAAGVAGTVAPGLIRKAVYEHAARLTKEQLAKHGVEADVRIHVAT